MNINDLLAMKKKIAQFRIKSEDAAKKARMVERMLARMMRPKRDGTGDVFRVKSEAHQETMAAVLARMPDSFDSSRFYAELAAANPSVGRPEAKHFLRRSVKQLLIEVVLDGQHGHGNSTLYEKLPIQDMVETMSKVS